MKGRLGAIFDELAAQLSHQAPDRTPWEHVPVLICVCAIEEGGERPDSTGLEASIYPAVQNLLLAAHAAGLGSVLTTRWKAREPEVLPLLGLSSGATVYAIVPLGWPDRRYGRSKRRPVNELTYRERYGQAW